MRCRGCNAREHREAGRYGSGVCVRVVPGTVHHLHADRGEPAVEVGG